MTDADLVARLEALEARVEALGAELLWLKAKLKSHEGLEARVEQIGFEVGQIAKIMLDASVPAEDFSAQRLDQLLEEIFQGAESLPFDEALRRAAALRNR